MGATAAGIVGLNMFLLSDKLCQAFTRDPQVVQVTLLPICTDLPLASLSSQASAVMNYDSRLTCTPCRLGCVCYITRRLPGHWLHTSYFGENMIICLSCRL